MQKVKIMLQITETKKIKKRVVDRKFKLALLGLRF